MTGKSSWVHSRTQGSIPMLFCRWLDVLWLLHSLLVPSNGWWLDQGRWSLYLFFCYCGNDQTMALYQTKCVIWKLLCFHYYWTWFVITLLELRCNRWMLWIECNRGWWSLDLLRSWLYVCFVVEILQDFTDYRDYMGLSLMVRLCKWSLLGLISYNLGGSITGKGIKHGVNMITYWMLGRHRVNRNKHDIQDSGHTLDQPQG